LFLFLLYTISFGILHLYFLGVLQGSSNQISYSLKFLGGIVSLSLSLSSQLDEKEEISVGIKMQVFDRMTIPIRRVWTGVATRFGVRKSAHMKLRKDISTCEYEDVRVMWEMLSRNEAETIRSPTTSKGRCRKRPMWNCFEWAKRAPFLCRSF
ncbi:hypothetical protein ERO13_D02G089132v2, partial [Gossypium hirsutum]